MTTTTTDTKAQSIKTRQPRRGRSRGTGRTARHNKESVPQPPAPHNADDDGHVTITPQFCRTAPSASVVGDGQDAQTQRWDTATPTTSTGDSADGPNAATQQIHRAAALVAQLRHLQRERVSSIDMQGRIGRKVGSFVRSVLGWRMDLPEKERAAICKQAEDMIGAIEDGLRSTNLGSELVAPFILASAAARRPFDERRKLLEKDMASIAKQLPGAAFAESVRGFTVMGLSIMYGEAGTIWTYRSPECLCKRFGVGWFIDPRTGLEERQRRIADTAAGTAAGYSARRRSVLWVIGDCLIKANGDEGKYRGIYLARKEREAARTDEDKPTSKMHAHRRAQRFMETRFLRDLWSAIRQTVNQ